MSASVSRSTQSVTASRTVLSRSRAFPPEVSSVRWLNSTSSSSPDVPYAVLRPSASSSAAARERFHAASIALFSSAAARSSQPKCSSTISARAVPFQ